MSTEEKKLPRVNCQLFFHDMEHKDRTEFLEKVLALMLEYQIPRVDVSIDAFSLAKLHLETPLF